MIGIIGAMEIEVELLLMRLDGKRTEEFSGITYTQGEFAGETVVVAQCGMGKVNAALCTQTMLLKFSPEIIINTGVAGSLSSEAKIGDIVIAEKAVQHDLDLTPLGFARGYISELDTVFLHCNPDVVKRLKSTAEKHGRCHVGTIATGDQFISCNETKKNIAENFGAIACEMEGASIAHVCAINNVAFGIVRTISDDADDASPEIFEKFLLEAAYKSVDIICRFM